MAEYEIGDEVVYGSHEERATVLTNRFDMTRTGRPGIVIRSHSSGGAFVASLHNLAPAPPTIDVYQYYMCNGPNGRSFQAQSSEELLDQLQKAYGDDCHVIWHYFNATTGKHF